MDIYKKKIKIDWMTCKGASRINEVNDRDI